MGASASTSSGPDINRPIAFWGGLFLLAVAVGLIALSAWFIFFTHANYATVLLEKPPLFLEKTGNTVFYMAPFAYLGLLVLGAYCSAVGLRGRGFPASVSKRLNRIVGALVIVGVSGMFAGSWFANLYWAEQFRSEGYVECSGSFTMTGKWFTVVWADSPRLCTDQHVREMLGSYKYDLSDVNAWISQRRS